MKCNNCGKATGERKFCGYVCTYQYYNRTRTLKPNVKYKCVVCGKSVEKWVSPSMHGKGGNTFEFCSRTCAGVGRRGDGHHAWKGGRQTDRGGYVRVYSPTHPHTDSKGYVLEHRLKMEKKIGRYLTADEVVHHRNDNPSDNRISNLQLFPDNAAHKAHHMKYRKRDKKGRMLPL